MSNLEIILHQYALVATVLLVAGLGIWSWLTRKKEDKPKLKRSGQWPAVRKKHLEMEPTCQACGTKKNLSVHHISPFHDNPSLELSHSNLITLCEEHHCHLVFGHLCSWYSYNHNVREDVKWFLEKVKKRP